MRPSQDSRISFDGERYHAKCENCGSAASSIYKCTIARILKRKVCKFCRRNYRDAEGDPPKVEGKWLSSCPECGVEQKYTRKNHAIGSETNGWKCRFCARKDREEGLSDERKLYNRFRKSASNRGLAWEITFEFFVACYSGKCALTDWELTMDARNRTASFDRIDSKKEYTIGNVQWVHTMVNMSKHTHPQNLFIEMCKAVAAKDEENAKDTKTCKS